MGIAGKARVAVILQALVRAEIAGVLFTVDPLSGSGERWIVEASWGLGEAVVSGLVTPDRYIISRTGHLRERHLGDKDIAIVAAEDGGLHQSRFTIQNGRKVPTWVREPLCVWPNWEQHANVYLAPLRISNGRFRMECCPSCSAVQ